MSDYLVAFQFSSIFKTVGYFQSLVGQPNPYALNQGQINALPWGESTDKAKRKEILTGLHHEVSSSVYPLGQCRNIHRVFPETLQIREVSTIPGVARI